MTAVPYCENCAQGMEKVGESDSGTDIWYECPDCDNSSVGLRMTVVAGDSEGKQPGDLDR
jgi:lysyl-tRNA synthetase class I